MNTSFLPIVLNVIVLVSLLIPVVRGFMNGFVKTVLHLLRFVVAFVVSCIFVKPLGLWIKEKWLGGKFYDTVYDALNKSFDGSADGMADAVPAGLKALLETFGFDLGGAASDAVGEGEGMLASFASTVADKLSSIASVAIAFVAIFLLSLIVVVLLTKVLNFLVEKIPFVRGLNRVLGLLAGAFIGVVTAWTTSQLIVFLLTTFTHVDYSQAVVLNFFHDISPLRWILQIIAQSMTGIMA